MIWTVFAVSVALVADVSIIVNPSWLVQPQPTQRTVFADFIGLSGRVTLRCDVTAAGTTEDCEVVDALPAGAGFERVAMESAVRGRLSPRTVDGVATRGKIQFSMNFGGNKEDWAPYDGPEPSTEAIELARPLAEWIVDHDRSGQIIADVADDRRARVQAWVDELLPFNRDKAVQSVTLRYARTLTLSQLRQLAAHRQPDGPLPDFRTLNSAADPDPEQVKAGAELRRRYCSEYDCRLP